MITLQYRRPDGTFVALVNGLPYHVTEEDPLFAEVSSEADDMGEGLPYEQSPPEPGLAGDVPLTARQLRLGLITNGFALEQVEAAISTIDDPQQRALAQVEWEYATLFERSHPLIAQVSSHLGLTEEQIDSMWQAAALL